MSDVASTPVPASPCDRIEVTADDGARVAATAHGAHVVSWATADGVERLWMSSAAVCGPGLAWRGGVPVCFPQFAGMGSLPKHGFVRDTAWEVVAAGRDAAGVAAITFAWTPGPDVAAVWPAPISARLVVRAAGDSLDIALTAANAGGEDVTITAALHTYYRVSDVADIRLDGVRGVVPSLANGTALDPFPTDAALPVVAPIDVIMRGVGNRRVVIDDPVLGRLAVDAAGFPDRVLWNPGPGHGLPDCPDGEERGFVCLEPAAALTPVVVPAGGSWTGSTTLTVLP
jgi:glucose-6-phosphate 1-epimerase